MTTENEARQNWYSPIYDFFTAILDAFAYILSSLGLYSFPNQEVPEEIVAIEPNIRSSITSLAETVADESAVDTEVTPCCYTGLFSCLEDKNHDVGSPSNRI